MNKNMGSLDRSLRIVAALIAVVVAVVVGASSAVGSCSSCSRGFPCDERSRVLPALPASSSRHVRSGPLARVGGKGRHERADELRTGVRTRVSLPAHGRVAR